ncbi:hypothetical protein K6T82_14145 [Flavobacterium sp. 17A]|uniref:Uncharacterized protein n=1 Tax=Flavobacterium potami TaxID=2872310 RepID=A0A9X1KS42_9FLAO|nr:hypothetical protein [Flavobacterium potami]MBZ4035916.1 hypothetical protein [Flavobacterium potami]
MEVNINHDLSPIKFLVLIKLEEDSKKVLDVFKSLSSIWAGIYCPIIIYHEKFPLNFLKRYNIEINEEEYYRNVIKNFDPDVLIYDNQIDSKVVQNFADGRKLIALSEFFDRVQKNRLNYSIGIDVLIENVYEEEFKYKRNDELKFSIPKIINDDLLLSAWIGNVTEEIHVNLIQEHLEPMNWYQKFELDYNNLGEFLNQNLFFTIPLIREKIDHVYDDYLDQSNLCYVIDRKEQLDVIDFWNLRAIGIKVLPIPFDKIHKEPFLERLLDLFKLKQKSKLSFKYLDFLTSPNVNSDEIFKEINSIKSINNFDNIVTAIKWFPRYWHSSKEILKYDSVLCPRYIFGYESKDTKIEEDNMVKVELPFLPFKTKNSNDGLFKSYVSFNFWNDEGKYAGVVSEITTEDLKKITNPYSFSNDWRVSNDSIIKYISYNGEREHYYIPKSFDFFSKYFSRKGLAISETSSTKLGKEVLRNIGGINGINIFSTQNAIKIIELFEGGKSISFEDLIGKIKQLKPFPEIKSPNEIIDLLLEKKIIEFGVNVKCLICEQKSFYLINELSDKMQCSICRNQFVLPKNDPKVTFKYAYRGLGSFTRNNKVDGLLCVFLTLRLFNLELADSNRELSFLMDFNIKKGKDEYEVDLAIIAKHYRNKWKPNSFVCECKTFKSFTKVDLDRLKFLGAHLPNVTLVVSTLKEEFDDDEKLLLTDLVNHFRDLNKLISTNPVLLLTAKELIPERRFSNLQEFEKEIPKHDHVDYIQYLSDLTCQKHLGLKTISELISDHLTKRK